MLQQKERSIHHSGQDAIGDKRGEGRSGKRRKQQSASRSKEKGRGMGGKMSADQ